MAEVSETCSVECSECCKRFSAPDPLKSKQDCIEAECPHCGKKLFLDRVCYWVSSGLGD